MSLDDLGVPLPGSSPTESSPMLGRSTPSTPSLKAAPMWANWTRCSVRTSTFAPASRNSVGRPGTGSSTATAGRCTPGSRLMCRSPAASAAPVEPAVTSGIGPPGRERLGGLHDRRVLLRPDGPRRLLVVPDPDRRVDHLDPSCGSGPSACRNSASGPNSTERIPEAAASTAPAATSAVPRSAPSASTATVATGPPRAEAGRPAHLPGACRSDRIPGQTR